MTVADFIVQYTLVVLGVLAVAHRDHFPLAVNNGVERDIKERERADDAFEAKIWLARMK